MSAVSAFKPSLPAGSLTEPLRMSMRNEMIGELGMGSSITRALVEVVLSLSISDEDAFIVLTIKNVMMVVANNKRNFILRSPRT
jgi:hypothetical protein